MRPLEIARRILTGRLHEEKYSSKPIIFCPLETERWETIGDSHVVADRDELEVGDPKDMMNADDHNAIKPSKLLHGPYVPSKANVATHKLSTQHVTKTSG